MQKARFEVETLETGYLVKVWPPQKKEPMFDNSPMQFMGPKEGAVSSPEEVHSLIGQWLEKGDVEFKKSKEGEAEKQTDTLLNAMGGRGLHDTYGQEPKIMG